MANHQVETFVQGVRKTLNRNLFWTILIWSAAIGAVALVLAGLVYIAQGFAVPKILYPLAIACAGIAAAGVWWLRKVTHATASQYADEHYGLKDTVTSCRNFADEGKQGGYFDLQAKQTDSKVKPISPTSIPFALPRAALTVGLVFGAAATLMAFIGPSQTVKDRMALEIATLDQTKQNNEALEELVKEIEEEIKDEEEAKLVEPNKLREWVQELKETKDQKEALRQYAKLEQKLQKASAKLQQRRDEQYLERAVKELEKGDETKKLAKQLEQKKYQDAAKELEKMKPDDGQKRSLTERKKKMAKLKAAAKRMAAAAKRSGKQGAAKQDRKSSSSQLAKAQTAKDSKNAAKSSSSQNASSQQNDSNSSQSEGSESEASETDPDSVEQLVEDLEEALAKLDKQLTDAEMQELEKGECDADKMAQCEKCEGEAGKKLGKLSKKLGQMAMKKKLQSKLSSLCKACSQCQSQCAGLCQGQGQGMAQSPNPGGKKAGFGSSDSRRQERDQSEDNGQYTQLKGQKGSGPSIAAVEAAEDGSGVSTAKNVAVARDFKRQMESFVEREDVPDDVKSGVRNYFEMIHQSEPSE